MLKSARRVLALLLVPFALELFGEPLSWPPTLPDGKPVVTDSSPDFLKVTPALKVDVSVAKTPPTVDFLYYPEQNYEGNPWSAWGDSLVAPNGKYYSSIGDHGAPGNKAPGNAYVYEYDPATQRLRTVVNVTQFLNLPEGDYRPGKIHSRLDLGEDGWIYFATHRGSGGATTDKFNYKGDWILRYHPGTGKTEIVAHAPVEKHCIPASVLDPKRLIFCGGTASGANAPEQRITFFAYDVRNRKVLYAGPNGCARYFILAPSTGKVYYEFTDDKGRSTGDLMRYDPEKGGPPVKATTCPGLRTATQETPQGYVYAVSNGQNGTSVLWSFNTRTEQVQEIGPAAVATQQYITTIDTDPSGRYLYYVPGAHGGSEADGCPIVQFDTTTKTKKVIAFLHPFLKDKYGFTPLGTFGSAVDPRGKTLYITWHGNRRGSGWDTCGMTAIHIPESERLP